MIVSTEHIIVACPNRSEGVSIVNHFAGDLALKEFAQRLAKAIRGSDLAVRIGGDEFLVLLPECQPGQVQHVLARLRLLEIDPDGKKVSFTFSSGWTDCQPGEGPEELLKACRRCALRRQAPQEQTMRIGAVTPRQVPGALPVS